MKPIVFAIIVFALALAVRLDGPRSVGPYDEAYHWKRIAWAAEGGPRTADSGPQITHGLTALDFDLDRGIHGAFCPWPPLYDAAMGAAAKMIGLERIIWIPPIAFALFVAMVVAIWGRRGRDGIATSRPRDLATTGDRDTERVILGRRSAAKDPLPVSPVRAVENPCVDAAPPTGVRHGAAVPYGASRQSLLTSTTAGVAIALSPYLIGISRIAAIDHHWAEPLLVVAIVAGVVRRSAIGLALAMAAAVFVQPALIVACGVALVAIVFVQAEGRALRAGAVAFAIAAAAVAIYRATRPEGYPSGPWFLGWTHVALLAAAAVACSVPASRLATSDDHGRTSVRWRLLGLSAGAVVVAPVAGSILGGTRFFSGDPWLQSIIEFQPMFRDTASIGTDLANLGGGVLALAIVAAAERLDRNRTNDSRRAGSLLDSPNVAVTALFAALYLVLAISSRRFLVPGIALFAIAGGIATASRRRWAAMAALALTIAPPLAYDVYALSHRQAEKFDAVMAVAAEVAPLPAGRVLAPWHAGHAIDVFGGHAVVIDNFGSMPGAQLFAEANAALIETSPPALRVWCRSRGVRYLALLDPDLHLPAAAACRGLDAQAYRRTPLARRTVWSRLWRGENIAGFSRVGEHVWGVGQE
jgi:hypothetical protein